jgi:hypothetical protein
MNVDRTGVPNLFYPMAHPSHPHLGNTGLGTFPQVRLWGGWGSNPRPADYESAALTG